MYSSTGNRNTANTNITNALNSVGYTGVATSFPAGVSTSGNAVRISVIVDDAQVETARSTLLTAWASATRATTGHWISTTKVEV